MPDLSVLVPLWLSFKVATVATLLGVVPAAAVGLLLARREFRGKALVETVVELPLVLPPTAVGFALLMLLGRDGLLGRATLGVDLGILFTWRAAVVAAVVMSFPLMVRTARLAFDHVDPRLERMAASLGMTPAEVFARVTLPISGRGLAAAALMGFSRALGEFGATTLVAGSIPGRTETLALAIFADIQLGHVERARVLLLVSVLLAFVAIAAVSRLSRRPESTIAR